MRESEIEGYLKKRVEAMGGLVRKVQWVGVNGAPDRLVTLPPSYRTRRDGGVYEERGGPIWVELKAPGKKPEPHQLREHERMRQFGMRVVVIDSLDGVDELLA